MEVGLDCRFLLLLYKKQVNVCLNAFRGPGEYAYCLTRWIDFFLRSVNPARTDSLGPLVGKFRVLIC